MAAQSVYVTGRDSGGTGLYYYRARYYDPVRSRFVSEDPLGFATGQTNLHTYVLANPLRFTDPHGLWTVSVGARIGATGFGYGVGGGMSINIGYSGGEGLSASLTGTFAGGASSASLLGGSSAGVQVDVSNASSVEGLTGAVVEGGRGLGRSGLGGFVSPGGNVKGGSLTIGIASRPSTLDIPGVSAGGSDTSSIIQIDRNGLHIGRRNGQSLLDLPVGCWLAGRCGVGGGGMLGPRKDRPPGSGND